MLDTILVPLDGSPISERVIPAIEPLARGLGAPVTLIHVVGLPSMPADVAAEHRGYLEEVQGQEMLRARGYLGALKGRLQAGGIEADTAVLQGRPAEMIVSYAHSQGVGVIAMSTHGRSGVGRWVIGSVADRVLHLAVLPVLLIRAAEAEKETPPAPVFQKILLPADGSPESERAIPFARHLAERLDLEVVVARVIPTVSFAFTEPYPFGGAEMAVGLWTALEKDAAEYLDRTVDALRAGGLRVQGALLRGDPAAELVNLAARTPGALVVMSTHGRAGVERLVLGSVADRLVRDSHSPVLLTRQPD